MAPLHRLFGDSSRAVTGLDANIVVSRARNDAPESNLWLLLLLAALWLSPPA